MSAKTPLKDITHRNKKIKVMLIIAPWDMWESENVSMYPNGLCSLASVLEKNNYEVDLLDLTFSKWENIKENIKKKILEMEPDIMGISILSNSRVSALRLTTFVKEINPKIKIIAGGVHTTCLYEQVLNNYPIDFAVIGEGELTILELLKAINGKKPLNFFKKIKGIAFKHGGKIIKTEPRERIKDLDSLPFQKHEFFRKVIEKNNFVQIMSSRGCPFSCSFCPSSVHWGRCMIQRSAENVFKELKYVLNKFPKVNRVLFLDDEFICDNQRVINLCKMIIDDKLDITWHCLGRVSSINEELISWMKRAGCREILFGIESGSQRILDNIGKKVRIEQIINSVELCKKYQINIGYLTIIGLPGENSASVNESIRLAKKLRVISEPAILIVYPGTEVYRLAKEKGLLTDEYWLSEGLCPLYTAEHSKLRLGWWSFKTGLISHLYADNGDVFDFLNRKIIKKISDIHNFKRVFGRYVSNKI